MEFVMKNAAPSEPRAVFDAYVDEDGDLTLDIDGVRVLFISVSDGDVNMCHLGHDTMKKLEAKGFKFTDNILKVTK